MREKYSLEQMLREIEEDEKVDQTDGQVLSQEEIIKILKERRQAQAKDKGSR